MCLICTAMRLTYNTAMCPVCTAVCLIGTAVCLNFACLLACHVMLEIL